MRFQTRREIKSPFDVIVAQLPQALKSEGFGLLTETDIQDTLKKKLGVSFRRYKIFGACNPPLAHQALQAELEVGLMLPCNVIVYESDQETTVVSAIDPTETMAAIGNRKLIDLAGQVRDKLARALSQLA
jgi:uncharacterized protein (DUF302 family)